MFSFGSWVQCAKFCIGEISFHFCVAWRGRKSAFRMDTNSHRFIGQAVGRSRFVMRASTENPGRRARRLVRTTTPTVKVACSRGLLCKLPRGPLTVHRASVLSSGEGGFYTLLSAGRTRGRMNLLVAIMQRTTILNFSGHALHTGRGQ